MVTQAEGGRLTSRVPNVSSLKNVYIGIASANELYDEIKTQLDSYFEIKTQYIGTSTPSQKYSFNKGNTRGDIQLINGRQAREQGIDTAKNEVVLTWDQIFEQVRSPSSLAQF